MTEQEADELAARLTRIWVPPGSGVEAVTWEATQNGIRFVGRVYDGNNESVEVTITDVLQVRSGKRLSMGAFRCCELEGERYSPEHKWQRSGALSFTAHNPVVSIVRDFVREELKDECERFAEQWLPVFRRNCWLSGCKIECSAHEQLEWNLWFDEQGEG